MMNSHSSRTILFLVPNKWTKNPRLSRELLTLSKAGFRTSIISTRLVYLIRFAASLPSNPPLSEMKASVHSVPLLAAPLASANGRYSKLTFTLLYALAATFYVFWMSILAIAICAARDVEIIHAHNSPDLTGLVAYLVSKATRTPYVYELHDLVPEMYAEMMNLPLESPPIRVLNLLEHLAVTNADKVIYVNNVMRDYVLAKHRLDAGKSVVIYGGWSTRYIASLDAGSKGAHVGDHEPFVVLYLGSLESKIRGLDDLVYATEILLKKNHRIKLVYVGDGPMRSSLARIVTERAMDDCVLLVGALSREKAWSWLVSSDVAVIPFRRFRSTNVATPQKLFEYMAAGKVVLASNLRGIKEIIREGHNGMTYEEGNPEELARKIQILIDTKASGNLQQLGSNAKIDFYRFYSWERQEQKLLNAYETLTNQKLSSERSSQ